MTTEGNRILDDAMSLSERDRADLAARLIASLDTAVEQGVESAWADEITRRLAELDRGEVSLIPWPDARRQIEESADNASPS